MLRALIRVIIPAVAIGGVSVGLLAWRLGRGAVALPVLVPWVEAALSPPDVGLATRVGSVELVWDGEDRRLELRGRDVRVSDRAGVRVATIPEVAVALSLRALARGTVAATRVELIRPRLVLVRRTDGGIEIELGRGAAASRAEPPSGHFLDAILARAATSRLRRVETTDAAILFVDRASGAVWRMRRAELDLWRVRDGIAGRLDARLALADRLVPLAAQMTAGRERGIDLSLATEGLPLDALVARLGPSGWAAGLSRARVAVGGRVELSLDDALRPLRAHVDVAGAGGALAIGRDETLLPITHLDLRADLDVAAQSLVIERFRLEAAAATLELTGRVHDVRGAGTLEVKVTAQHLETGDVARLWPADFAPAARQWVASSVSGGRLRELTAELAGRVDRLDAATFAVDTLGGTLVFDGLTIGLPAALPSASGIAGTATLARDAVRFRVARGAIGGLEITRAAIDVTGLTATAPRLALDTALRGSLARTLAVVERVTPPGTVAIAATKVGGSAQTRVTLAFVPRDGLALSDLGLVASAKVRDASVPDLARGWSFTRGDLDVDLRGTALTIAGSARVHGAPASLRLEESLGRPERRRIQVAARLGSEDRTTLGLDTRPWLTGPIDVKMRLAPDWQTTGIEVDVDLAGSGLDLPLLGITKPAGRPGRAEARLLVTGEVVTRVEDASLAAEGSRVTGHATFAADGRRLRTAEVSAAVRPAAAGGRVGHVVLTLRPAGERNRFEVTSDDAGALFRALGSYGDASGGRLVFEGTIDLVNAGLPLDGTLDIRGTKLTRAPILMRVATLTSLVGLSEALSSGGIKLDRVTAHISHRDGTVTFTDTRAEGSSVTLLVSGRIMRTSGTIALTGTVVPSYFGLNRAPGRIPILGTLATGGKDEGVLGVDFEVSGPLADPRVTVKPLSSLAPGVLRRLLRGRSAPP